ncbi:MAG: DUF3179 domain-containing protein [Cellvibrionaceae bacterium]
MAGLIVLLAGMQACATEPPQTLADQWPRTDFSRITVDPAEITAGGPGKDGIPAIDNPRFVSLDEMSQLGKEEPVIGMVVDGEAKAYPLRILTWHEIVNDEIGGIPVAVTYCPLCNTSIVFDRRLEGRVLDFGATGLLRHSDLIMYDRQTESWWQQYSGDAIVGALTGKQLSTVPARLESLEDFRWRAPQGLVLVPNDPRARDYGANPYAGYDRSATPFMFSGKMPDGVKPMTRVVAIEELAFSLPYLREKEVIEQDGLRITWHAGQNSALDKRSIRRGRDVGNVIVSRDGSDIPYVVTFAFAFFAFNPDGRLVMSESETIMQKTGATGLEPTSSRQRF